MKITFLLDENIPYVLNDFLVGKGFTAYHLKRLNKTGIKNGEVYRIAEKMNAWIITRDTDFQNLWRFRQYNILGIILFKLSKTKTAFLLNAMRDFLEKFEGRLRKKSLIIIEDDQVKIY